MGRIVPVVLLVCGLLVSCVLPTEQASFVRAVELPLDPSGAFGTGDPRGMVRKDGTWELRRTVTHSRLRCGTYETGIQLGRLGATAQSCAEAEWVTDVRYGSRHRQCNSAPRIHNASGSFDDLGSMPEGVNCVRVVTRCSGTCG